jgi:hypothetical protein
MAFTRRFVLATLPAAGASALSGPVSANAEEAMTLSSPLSPDLDTLIRIRGHQSRPFWLWFEGAVYGRAPDDPVRPLFGFTSLLRVRYGRSADGSVFLDQRESAHYTDLATGEMIGRFHNPYLGRSNVAIGYVSPLLRFGFSIEGTFDIDTGDQIGSFLPALAGDTAQVWTTERRANEFASNISPQMFPDAYRTPIRRSADIATYRARVEDLAGGLDTFVPASTDIVADTPWPLWMFMGDRPGHVIWIGHGMKVEHTEEVPAPLRRRVEAAHPGFIAAPWDLDGAAYSTGRQMRDLRARGEI